METGTGLSGITWRKGKIISRKKWWNFYALSILFIGPHEFFRYYVDSSYVYQIGTR